MRITAFLLVFCGLNLFAAGTYSQNSKVKISARNTSLKEVLREIEKQTDYLFVYNPTEIDVNQKTTLTAENKAVKDVLATVFNQTDIVYLMEGNSILLMKRPDGIQQSDNKRITGTVFDNKGEAVIGASVVVKGTAKGLATDVNGKFNLNVPDNAVLQVSYLGYLTQEIPVGNQTSLSITLKEDVLGLDEVVVIGYGTVKKSDLTGSVSSVAAKQFKDQPVKRVTDILQGRIAGVEVTASSGLLGGSYKVRIRGTTSINKSSDPLYVVDGIVSNTGLPGINPNDIQSLEVLKDASATAIYGSRGANGVILVTTRGGVEGKPQISFDASFEWNKLRKGYDLMNAYEYATALNDIKGNITISAADMEAYKNGTKGIDYMDLVTQTGFNQDYKLSVSGGNAKNRYMVSGNVLDEEAITILSKRQRYQFRVNLDTDVTNWFSISTKLNANIIKSHNSGGINLMTALGYSPTMELKNEQTGVYNKDPYNNAPANNPYGIGIVNYSDSYNHNLNGNVNLLFKVMDGLTLSVQGGTNYSYGPTYSFTSNLAGPGVINSMANSSTLVLYLQNTNNLTYQKSFGDHKITATAVWEISNTEQRQMGITGTNLANEIVGYWNVGNAATRGESNSYSAESIASGVGRLFYSYKGRYMLTGTFRADGASKFQGDNKWGYFPSGSVAWDVAKEGFMEDQNIFQQLKLRTSYGVTGNQDITRYSTLGMLSTNTYGWGTSTAYTGYWGFTFATPDLSWEKTYQYDAGVDFSLLSGKVNVTLDWYQKNSKGLLFQKTVPGYNAGGTFWVNQGEVKNSGIDFSVNAIPVQSNDFSWETTLTATHIKNEVVDLAGEDFILTANWATSTFGGYSQIMKPGYPINTFYLYKWKSFDDNGANLYEKADGSLTNNPSGDDMVEMGQGSPKWTFGWNNMVSWKNWSASVFINAATGF
ncbi:MAG: TonB-dependent receptor, partial [Tannerella sp.]|nr:TonB-dependent receptor [Tannerella sp.]